MAFADFFAVHKGSVHCVTFGVMVTLQVNLAKVLTYSSHTSYITVIRSVFAIFMALPFVEWDATNTHDDIDLLLYLGSAISNLGLCGLGVFGFNYLGVGDSTAIEFGGSLILVGVIGHFFLNEKLSIPYFVLLLFDCVGIVLVAQPSIIFGTSGASLEGRETGAIITLGAAFFFAMWHVVVRKLAQRNTLHCWLMIYIHGLVGLVIAGAWTAAESAWKVPDTWFTGLVFIGNGVTSTLQLVTGFKALANEDAKKVALVLTLSVVLSYVLQLTVFEEKFDWMSIIGSMIVVVCVVLSECWNYIQDKINNLRESYKILEANKH